MKNLITLLLLLSNTLMAGPAGSAYQVLRIPSGGGIPKYGSIDLSQSAAVGSSVLPAANGGNNLGTAGVSNAIMLNNVSATFSHAANAATISLKQADGTSDCTALAPCKIGFENNVGNGYTTRSVTGALSVTIPSGTTIGTRSNIQETIYVYAQDDSGTVRLAVSLASLDQGDLQPTTTIAGGSSRTALYGLSGGGNPTRLITKIKSTQTTAGTWAANADTISQYPFNHDQIIGATNGPWKIVTAQVACSGSSTINHQDGTWITSLSNQAGNVCTITFATGLFSATPHCVAAPASYAAIIVSFNATSSTQTTIGGYSDGGSPVGTGTYDIMCYGLK